MGAGMSSVAVMIASLVTALVSALLICALRGAYHSGFRDGAKWLQEGDTYPSKPGHEWWGWEVLKRETNYDKRHKDNERRYHYDA